MLMVLSSNIVFGENISGTGWFFEESNGDKEIILFGKDGTFKHLNVVSSSGNEGEIDGDENETYSVNGDLVVISYNDGYKICSLTINSRKDRMSGTSINKKGIVRQIKGRLID